MHPISMSPGLRHNVQGLALKLAEPSPFSGCSKAG